MKRIVILPDLHAPDVDWVSLNPVLHFIKYYKPTSFYQLGDVCNFDSLSSYEPRNVEGIKNTIDIETLSTKELISKIDNVLPKNCEKFICGGNHEARYNKFVVNHGYKTEIAMLHKFSTWQEELGLSDWNTCEYGEWFKLGHIIITHGWYAGGNHAKKHLGLFHKCIFYGHTHEFQVATSTGLDGLPIMSASIGTLSKFNLHYLVGKPPVNWTSMFAYIDMRDDGTFTPHFTTIVNGRFIELGKEFK